MINKLLLDESKNFNGKKLLASGNESLTFSQIHDTIKQTYDSQNIIFKNASKKNKIKNKNPLLKILVNNWHLFFHGNTHTTNFNFMLNQLDQTTPKFTSYENATELLGINAKSLKEYYSEIEKKSNRNSSNSEEQTDDFKLPNFQNYYKISLD